MWNSGTTSGLVPGSGLLPSHIKCVYNFIKYVFSFKLECSIVLGTMIMDTVQKI